ncbi:MAG: glycine cleavage system protein GcvH [Hyphomonadaceae bacterium]|nr:glycine cleavage system protein GcvH [Hyphomonadaceae bacterium]MBC6412109.1 glycine cleavage system protein GcvH [Hyphomonadaceae bacterium]
MSLYFTQDHEWIRVDGDIGTVGISPYAARQLGDVVYVELPGIGANPGRGDEIAVVESVKAASEIYAPVGGEITEVNKALEDDPGTVNDSADEDGWFLRMKLSDMSELESLMDEAEYREYCEGL